VALIESNFFENALNPVTSRYSAYTPDRAGCVKQIVFAQAGARL
jgi:hypothetical protein